MKQATKVSWARAFSLFVVLIMPMLHGCYLSVVPLTFREVRDYTLHSKQTISSPISQVARAACLSLREMGFTLKRIEYRTDPAIIEASWEEVNVDLRLTALTEKTTLIKSKVKMSSGAREYSLEEELFANIRSTLADHRFPAMIDLARGLSPIYIKPSDDSAKIAFVRSGEKLEVSDSTDDWYKVEMKSGAEGFIPKSLARK